MHIPALVGWQSQFLVITTVYTQVFIQANAQEVLGSYHRLVKTRDASVNNGHGFLREIIFVMLKGLFQVMSSGKSISARALRNWPA
jgi:hypothetical protein